MCLSHCAFSYSLFPIYNRPVTPMNRIHLSCPANRSSVIQAIKIYLEMKVMLFCVRYKPIQPRDEKYISAVYFASRDSVTGCVKGLRNWCWCRHSCKPQKGVSAWERLQTLLELEIFDCSVHLPEERMSLCTQTLKELRICTLCLTFSKFLSIKIGIHHHGSENVSCYFQFLTFFFLVVPQLEN